MYPFTLGVYSAAMGCSFVKDCDSY